MNIGILYICTGKYDRFFRDFFESTEKLFMPSDKKTYYVFTDSDDAIFDNEKIVKIYQSKLGWPKDTLMRFHMFSSISEDLKKEDFIFFFNANMIVLEEISQEMILPNEENEWLVSVLHSSFFNTGIKGTFETRTESLAYISPDQNPFYFQGCLFGGRSEEFLKMIEICKKNVQTDLDKSVIAIWHDESHMNKYFSNKNIKALHPGFAYPEVRILGYPKLILQIEKSIIPGGHNYLRS